jgi:hypothetical protein
MNIDILDEDDDSDTKKALKKQMRVECRAFARVLQTKDGKLLLESIKRDIGWDQSGPVNQDSEHPIHHWLGQRSVVWGMMHKAGLGEKLSNHKENDE